MEQNGFFEQPRKMDLKNINLQFFGEEESANTLRIVAFKNTGWIRINKLTMFLGDNSAGKSVLYQVVRLLKKCYDLLDLEKHFSDFGAVEDIVGTFEDAHNKNSEEQQISFSFLFENTKIGGQTYVYQIEITPVLEHKYGMVSSVTLEKDTENHELLKYYDSQNLFFLRRKKGFEIPDEVEKNVIQIMEALRNFAGQIRTISYHRHIPERKMIFTGSQKKYVESNGENAYEMLIQLAESDSEREKKINSWLNKFGYTYHWDSEEKNIGEFMLVNNKTGKKSNIVDNGLGISQSLPIAVEMSDLKGSTILLDTPEAFLQTRMQSEMGDLLIEGAKTGNILAETGSEYIVLRIQRRISEGLIEAKDVSIYFLCDNDGDGSTECKILEINSFGEFVNIPEQFKFFFSSVGVAYNTDRQIITEDSDYGVHDEEEKKDINHYMKEEMNLSICSAEQALENILG